MRTPPHIVVLIWAIFGVVAGLSWLVGWEWWKP